MSLNLAGLDPVAVAATIAAATLVSEDGTCIAAGLLAREGGLNLTLAIVACTLGIFLGDFGLWLVGRICGPRVLEWSWVRRNTPTHRIDQLTDWFRRSGWQAIIAARFLPGARLPIYLLAGALGQRVWQFALWSGIAALLWTPALVLLVATLGDVVVSPLRRFFGGGWLPVLVALVAMWVALHIAWRLCDPIGRVRLWVSLSRVWRWEFWPAWLFYTPLVPWIAYLAVRHRGVMVPTAANPGIKPHGGIVGESKFDVLAALPPERIVPTERIDAGPVAERIAKMHETIAARGWTLPLILKPDMGQRGAGVRLARDRTTAEAYLRDVAGPVIVQTYHPGPHEAGVFYYRFPDRPYGAIFSITAKEFPHVVGDGKSTVEQLIWRHSRLRMQAGTFLARLGERAQTVLRAGESLRLAIAGNHCQGTLFRDGAHLITPALTAAIDEIARQCDGFYFGRFDIRFADEEAFKAGREFAIVELNGVTSESTNLYDPSWSLLRAYRTLFRQWSLLFEIGARNRERGNRCSRIADVVSDTRAHYRTGVARLAAD
ncbi:MAG: VTT domain-containing protein [Phycisphaerae bacterium]